MSHETVRLRLGAVLGGLAAFRVGGTAKLREAE